MDNVEYFLSAHRMERLAKMIEAETGLFFPEAKWRDLKAAIHRMTLAMDLSHDEECMDWLLSGPWEQSKTDFCGRHLTVGETYFFREPRAFDLVCDYAREKLEKSAGAHSRLRIWSAGCCTGEEPYSIAMALKSALPGMDPRRISILGTDISSHHLQFARTGVYRNWSFRSALTASKQTFFSQESEGQFRLGDHIKELVKFAELNLAAPAYPSTATDTAAIDIIFCRNVLMYFSRQQALKVVERFRRCLVNGGWLIVSPSEASSELFSGFSSMVHPDGIYYQKSYPVHSLQRHLHHAQSGFPGTRPQRDLLQTVLSKTGPMPAASAPAQDAAARGPDFRLERESALDTQAPTPAVESTLRQAETGADAVLRAHALANEGKPAQAIRCLEQAIESWPTAAELYHARALIAMECGAAHDAIQNFKRVLYLQPDFILAHYLMGVLQSAQNRHQEATRQFETASGLLATLKDDEIVPGSEGLSAAYLQEAVRCFLHKEGV